MNRFAIYASAIALGFCLTSGEAAAQQQVAALPASVIIALPAGFSRYCSVANSSGQWAFEFTQADPCLTALGLVSGGTVRRAGIYSTSGGNNVMARCSGYGTSPYIVRGSSTSILTAAKSDNNSATGCIFIVAPTALPIFGHPWQAATGQTDPDVGVSLPSGFNYNIFGGIVPADAHTHWNVADFGQTQTPTNTSVRFAVQVDRYGMEQGHSADSGECPLGTPWCIKKSNTGRAFEGAYDWSMNDGRPLVAVAPGVIRRAVMRDVTGMCGTLTRNLTQGEIFIESQVDTGWYAEHFVAAYHHMWSVNQPGTSSPWPDGTTVSRGTVISAVGNTGCSSGPHLDLSVIRLTNLTGTYGYTFQALPSSTCGYGVNGAQGSMDPFGWAAPTGIDPYAYSFINFSDNSYWPNSNVVTANGDVFDGPGAYSINLWIPGSSPNQPPPTY